MSIYSLYYRPTKHAEIDVADVLLGVAAVATLYFILVLIALTF